MLFQLNIVLGILVAFLSNYFLVGVAGNSDWRWMLGVMALPSCIYTLLLLGICESPRWLMLKKNDRHEVMRPDSYRENLIGTKEEIDKLAIANEAGRDPSDAPGLFSGRYTRVLALSFLMVFFNQFSGISFILFYAPEIFAKAGFAAADSLLSAVSAGLVNLIFTFIGIQLIDRIGRKQLMYLGSVGYITSLSMVAYGFYFNATASFTLVFVLLFIVSHAIGQGAVVWVFIAEIFPTKVRSFGQAWGSGFLNGFAALTTSFGAVLINSFDPWIIFAFFAGLMVLQLVFVWVAMPETKGVSLEELERELTAG
jgi:MFS family permease